MFLGLKSRPINAEISILKKTLAKLTTLQKKKEITIETFRGENFRINVDLKCRSLEIAVDT